jgi:hypothetical protein
MPRVLHSTEDVIEALGGIRAVAQLMNVGITAVHNWRSWNEFPPRTYLVLTNKLERIGLRAPAKLWRMLEPI